jgi:Tfp pilus assembly protein PilO
MIDRMTPRAAALVGGAFFLLVLLVGWFVFVSPKQAEATDLDTSITETQVKLNIAEALVRGSKARNADVARLTKAMPPDVRMSAILRELSAASASANVRINSVSPQGATPVGSYAATPIAVTLEGKYFNVARFLHLLHSRAEIAAASKVTGPGRLYSVPQLQLTGGGEGGLLQVTTTIDTYSFTGASATPAPTEPTPESSSASASLGSAQGQ